MTWKIKAIALKHPITVGEKTIAAVVLREPDLNALEAIEELALKDGVPPSVAQLRGIIVAIGDQPDAIVGKLHRDDFAAITEEIAPFLSGEETEAPAT